MLPGIKKLAKCHKMDAEALDGWIKAVRDEYQRNAKRSTDIARKKEVRALLEPIARQAKELQDSIDKLPLQIQRGLDYLPVGEDSLLGNLSIELPFLASRATEVMQGWKKKKIKDTATNIAIMRITRAWRRLTGMPAAYKTADSDTRNDPAPQYYSGKWCGEFLDFFTVACDMVGIKDREGLPVSADAAVKQFVELDKRNLTQR